MTSEHTAGRSAGSLPRFLSPRHVARPRRNRALVQVGLLLVITVGFVIYGAAGGSLVFWATESTSARDGAVYGLGAGVVVAIVVMLALNGVFGSIDQRQRRVNCPTTPSRRRSTGPARNWTVSSPWWTARPN